MTPDMCTLRGDAIVRKDDSYDDGRPVSAGLIGGKAWCHPGVIKRVARTAKQPCVDGQVTPENMAGDTELERQINAYLTYRFILKEGMPADECFNEARDIVALVTRYAE